MAQAQEWLTRRFKGLLCEDFPGDVRLYSTAGLTLPSDFASHCVRYQVGQLLDEQHLERADAVVIFCNPFVEAEVQLLGKFIAAADALGATAPPMFWAPHTTLPETRLADELLDVNRQDLVTDFMDLGLDGVLVGEPEGFYLSLAVRAQIRKSNSLSQSLNATVNELRARSSQTNHLSECIRCTLWDYARVRLASCIPPIDYNLPPGRLQQLGDWQYGEVLGQGMTGTVYNLVPIAGTASEGSPHQVVKVVDKSGMKDVADVKVMKRMIEIMTLLSSHWAHPGLTKLHEIYHSPTHMLFRMEHGGSENLYRRLSQRQKPVDSRPLSLAKAVSVIEQAITVIAHLHLGPNVCHRDLKPENFLVNEMVDSCVLKLTDFDLARQFNVDVVCKNPCGTLPFTAPEVILEKEYDGAACDIWSLGIVLLEVVCGVRVVEQALNMQDLQVRAGHRPDTGIARRIRAGFQTRGSASNILSQLCRPELQSLLPSCRPLLDGMIDVVPTQRWNAQQMQKHFCCPGAQATQ